MCRHHLIVLPEHSDSRSAGVSLIYTRPNSKNLANFFSPSQMLLLRLLRLCTTQTHHTSPDRNLFFFFIIILFPNKHSRCLPSSLFFFRILINRAPFQRGSSSQQTVVVLCFTLWQNHHKILLRISKAEVYGHNFLIEESHHFFIVSSFNTWL